MHFGVYSVPGVGSEWFWMSSTFNDTDCYEYLQQNFKPDFEYPEFAPKLTMEFFDADLLSDIVAESGAK